MFQSTVLGLFSVSGAVRSSFSPLRAYNKAVMASSTISELAYSKIVAHACKFPHGAVSGLLVGDSNGQEIVDAFPVLHRHLALSMAMETALEQVRFLAVHV